MLLRTISIGTRAALGFAVITLIVLFIGSFSLMQMATLDRAANRINDVWLPGITSVQKLSLSINTIRLEGQRIRASDDPKVRQKSHALIADAEQALETQLAEYRNRQNGAEETALLDALKVSLERYIPTLDNVISLLDNRLPDTEQIERLNARLASTGEELTRGMNQLVKLNEAGANAAAHETRSLYANMQVIVGLILALSVAVTIVLALVLTRSIVRRWRLPRPSPKGI